MVFNMKSFEEIEAEYKRRVELLCTRGNHDVLTYEKLDEYRRQPVQFLYTVIDELKKSDLSDENKALAVSGVALITVAILKSPASYLSRSLLWSIGVSDDNKIDPNSGEKMLKKAMKFFEEKVFTNGDSRQPLLENHVFFTKNKDLKFDDYYYKGVLMLADYSRDKYADARNALTITIREREEAERQASNKNAPSYLSSLSSLWTAAPKKPVVITNNEDSTNKAYSTIRSV